MDFLIHFRHAPILALFMQIKVWNFTLAHCHSNDNYSLHFALWKFHSYYLFTLYPFFSSKLSLPSPNEFCHMQPSLSHSTLKTEWKLIYLDTHPEHTECTMSREVVIFPSSHNRALSSTDFETSCWFNRATIQIIVLAAFVFTAGIDYCRWSCAEGGNLEPRQTVTLSCFVFFLPF